MEVNIDEAMLVAKRWLKEPETEILYMDNNRLVLKHKTGYELSVTKTKTKAFFTAPKKPTSPPESELES